MAEMAKFRQQNITNWTPPYETSFKEIAKASPISSVVSLGVAPLVSQIAGGVGNALSALFTPDDRTASQRVMNNVAVGTQRAAEGFNTAAKTLAAPVAAAAPLITPLAPPIAAPPADTGPTSHTPVVAAPRRVLKAPWDGNPSSHTEAPVIPMAENRMGEAWVPVEGEPKISTMSSGGFRDINPSGIKGVDVPVGGGFAESNGQVFRLRGATPEELYANQQADKNYVAPVADPNAIVQTIGTANGVQQLKAGEELTPDVGNMTPGQFMSFRQQQSLKAAASNQSYRAALANSANVTANATTAKLPGELKLNDAQIQDFKEKQDIARRTIGVAEYLAPGQNKENVAKAGVHDETATALREDRKNATSLAIATLKAGGTDGKVSAKQQAEASEKATSEANNHIKGLGGIFPKDPATGKAYEPKKYDQMMYDAYLDRELRYQASLNPAPTVAGATPSARVAFNKAAYSKALMMIDGKSGATPEERAAAEAYVRTAGKTPK